MKLEAGKYYRTAGGAKAYVAGFNPDMPNSTDLCVIGWLDGHAQTWQNTSNGIDRAYATPIDGGLSNDDLIAEWVEPKRIKGWVNIYDGFLSGPYSCKGVADSGNDRTDGLANRLACIEIDCLEGEGL